MSGLTHTGPAGPGLVAQEEHLQMLRNASAIGLQQAVWALLWVSIYVWSQNVRRLNASLLPHTLWPAGLQRVGKELLELLLQSPA